jgi:hypothetical protein
VQRERLVRGERAKAGGAGAVPDQATWGHVGSSSGDLAVGNAQQDGLGIAGIGTAAEWPIDVITRLRQRGGQG